MIDCLYEQFKPWAAKGSVYVISDPHFGDIDMNWRMECGPLDYVDDVDMARHLGSYIVNIINRYCYKNDTLVILGDIGNPDYLRYIKAGRVVVIMGNHDAGNKTLLESYVGKENVFAGPLMIAPKLMLSHEPCEGPWSNIHGHKHDLDFMPRPQDLCVCCEKTGFKPINLGAAIKNGLMSGVDDIHRVAINAAAARKSNGNEILI